MKHTPGPWRISKCQLGKKLLIEHGTEDTASPCIAAIYSDGGLLPQHPNATLIAAAPDLLKALEEVARWDEESGIEDEWPVVMENVRQAIAKAEGREP